jgi:Virus neck protein
MGSQYFNNYNSRYHEQRLVEDLIVESIKIMGFDSFYIPNSNEGARDLLYGEDPLKTFTSHFPMEMYLSTSNDYMGEQEFFSKFGLEIRNQVKVIVSKRTFSERIPQNTHTRPLEGDLVFVPFLNGTGELYEIKFVDQNKDFATLGRSVPYFYELSLEKFKYSNEMINTGHETIDVILQEESYSVAFIVGSGTGKYIPSENIYQSANGSIYGATAIAFVQSWIPSTNTLTVTNLTGDFTSNTLLIGESSNAQYVLVSYNPLDNQATHDTYDNLLINTQANNIIDTSEINSFGKI